MAASFDDQFEAWLTDRLRAIKDRALRPFDGTSTSADRRRVSRSRDAMSRRVSSAAGNYYKFVYDEDSADDDDNDDTLPPISPVDDEPELLPEIERRQRLCRLLGTDTMLALDLADSESGDLDQLENVHRPELDENLNRKVGGAGTFMSRAQDYSTTSLEFSDMDSLVSDSVGRRSDEDGGWNHPEPLGREDQLQLDREPVSFVEFTPANDEDADVDEHPRRKRRSGSKQPRYDQLVPVRYHREDFADVDSVNNHGDFIDDDALLQRSPPGNDVIVTSHAADVGRQQLPMTSVLPLDVVEMAMDESCCEIHTARDRDPIVRVDDPEYDPRYFKSTPCCCCCRPRMTWQRRLFIVAGSIALLTAAALLAILIFLVVTRP